MLMINYESSVLNTYLIFIRINMYTIFKLNFNDMNNITQHPSIVTQVITVRASYD